MELFRKSLSPHLQMPFTRPETPPRHHDGQVFAEIINAIEMPKVTISPPLYGLIEDAAGRACPAATWLREISAVAASSIRLKIRYTLAAA
jgi:hypothetical protein